MKNEKYLNLKKAFDYYRVKLNCSIVTENNSKLLIKGVHDLQKKYDITVPQPVIDWLKYFNGLPVGTTSFYGVNSKSGNNIDDILSFAHEFVHKNWIPIADDGCGNYYVAFMYANRVPIGFVDTIKSVDEITYLYATNINVFTWMYINNEINDLDTRWPFCKKDVIIKDPEFEEISKNCGVKYLPWEKGY